jgi:hypothetical protein
MQPLRLAFGVGRELGFVVEFRSSSGRVGLPTQPRPVAQFNLPLAELLATVGPANRSRIAVSMSRAR